jgi:hypothetical protein
MTRTEASARRTLAAIAIFGLLCSPLALWKIIDLTRALWRLTAEWCK